MSSTYDDVSNALNYISSDCPRNEWFTILCAIHDALGQNGYELAQDWSKQSSKKFNQRNFDSTWRSIKQGAITKATLFEKAYKNGMPRPVKSEPISTTKKESGLSQSQDEPPSFDEPPIDVYDDLGCTASNSSESFDKPIAKIVVVPNTVTQTRSNDDAKRANVLRQWNALKPFESHEYIVKKGLTGKLNGYEVNLRIGYSKTPKFEDGKILGNFFAYPLIDLKTGQITGFQRISITGKALGKDSQKTGVGIIGDLDKSNAIVCISEGFADGLEIRHTVKHTVLVASDAGNIPSVVESVRKCYPQCKIVICPDNDDAGRDGAEKAVKALNGQNVVVVYPVNKDFSDDVLSGLNISESIQKAIEAKLTEAKTTIKPTESTEHFQFREEWHKKLALISKKNAKSVIPNIYSMIAVIRNDKNLKDLFGYNQFTSKVIKREKTSIINWDTDELSEDDVTRIREYFCKSLSYLQSERCTWNSVDLIAAINRVAIERHSYHPVKDYLNSLKWDGISRIDDFFSDHCGTEKNEYSAFVARSLFVSLVARIMKPGCKVDTVVILEGKQGIGKSSLFRVLCSNEDWFRDSEIDLDSKDAYTALLGKWIIELAELDSLNKAETTRIKSFITSQVDSYRQPYGRMDVDKKRQCCFVGTTNKSNYLKDETGNRRFLPVKCQYVDIEAILSSRDQLWAEAVVLYKNGEKWWYDKNDEKLFNAITEEQAQRYEGDAWETEIAEYAKTRDMFTINDVATSCLKMDTKDVNRLTETRIGKILHSLGYERVRKRINGELRYVYTNTNTLSPMSSGETEFINLLKTKGSQYIGDVSKKLNIEFDKAIQLRKILQAKGLIKSVAPDQLLHSLIELASK